MLLFFSLASVLNASTSSAAEVNQTNVSTSVVMVIHLLVMVTAIQVLILILKVYHFQPTNPIRVIRLQQEELL